MGRQKADVARAQAMSQATQDQGNAQTSFANTQSELGNYKNNLGNFMGFARDTYSPTGEFARTQNAINTQAAAAGSRNIAGQLALRAGRTGENTASYAPSLAEAQRAASRDVTGALAQSNAERLKTLTGLEQFGVDASKFPATVQASLYGPSIQGAVGNLGVAERAATQNPSFTDVFGEQLAKSLGSVNASGQNSSGASVGIGG